MTLYQLPGLGVLFGSCSGTRLSLTPELIDNDDLAFCTGPIDGWSLAHKGREIALGPNDAIVDLARKRDVAAIVVGSRGLTGLRARLEGSTSNAVAKHASCPVVLVHEE